MEYLENLEAVERDPARLGGAWVFRDTHVPVATLFENLRDGATVNEFLAWNAPRLKPFLIMRWKSLIDYNWPPHAFILNPALGGQRSAVTLAATPQPLPATAR